MNNYNHLSEKERETLYYYLCKWYKQYKIADILGRNPSTISRELKRNSTSIWPKHKEKVYLPDKANNKYIKRRKVTYSWRRIFNGIDIHRVISLLKLWRSPIIISGYLKYLKVGSISHEAIYQFIYSQEYKYLKLWEYLPLRRKKRKIKRWRKVKRHIIPNKISIHERNKKIETRKEFGHWESDTIEWLRWHSCLHVSVERKTRYVKIRKITSKSYYITSQVMIDIFKQFDNDAVRSTTPDNWIEFIWWERVAKEIWMDFYFTDPYASRQKGTVERINWFIRKFFPKKTDFDLISDDDIQLVEDWINNRPMVCLWFKTPKQCFHKETLKIKPNFLKIALAFWN